jgi:hypothetical protein
MCTSYGKVKSVPPCSIEGLSHRSACGVFTSFLRIRRLTEAVIFEPVAVALDVDDLGVMKETAEDGRGDHSATEKLLPVAEALVRGQDRGALLVALGDELEEEVGLAAIAGR